MPPRDPVACLRRRCVAPCHHLPHWFRRPALSLYCRVRYYLHGVPGDSPEAVAVHRHRRTISHAERQGTDRKSENVPFEGTRAELLIHIRGSPGAGEDPAPHPFGLEIEGDLSACVIGLEPEWP